MHNDQPNQPAQATAPPAHLELEGLKAFIKQALVNTSQAFVAPTLTGALLPAPYRSLAFVPAGAVLAHQRLHPGPLRFDPAVPHHDGLVVAGIGFAPFLLFLPLHAKYAHLDSPLGEKVRLAWAKVTRQLRGPLGQVLQKYPVNFVFVRAAAQLGASALGAALALQYVTTNHGSRLIAQDPAPPKPVNGREQAQVLATGAAWFAGPAILGMPQVRSLVPGLRQMGPTATTAFVTAGLIAAALGTIAQVQSHTAPSITGA